MATLLNLKDWLARKSRPDAVPVTVSMFGFTVGQTFVAWQTVSEIWGFKADRITTDEAILEFSTGGQTVSVGEAQPGFLELEAAMIAACPATSEWRQALLAPAFAHDRTLLYRRA